MRGRTLASLGHITTSTTLAETQALHDACCLVLETVPGARDNRPLRAGVEAIGRSVDRSRDRTNLTLMEAAAVHLAARLVDAGGVDEQLPAAVAALERDLKAKGALLTEEGWIA